MSNHEEKFWANHVHLFLALARTKDGEKARCIRSVIKDEMMDLKILETKLQIFGGEWRIHHTVNARDTQKALKSLLHVLIDHPEKASHIDSVWRTALLQSNCVYGPKRFMLDIDTKDFAQLEVIESKLSNTIIHTKLESPAGWHYIIDPCDTREVCALPNVTLLRDGYYYVKTVSN